MAAKFFHQDFHFGQRHGRTTGDLDQHARRIGQHPALVHQRIFERLSKRVVRPVIGFGFAKTKQAASVLTSQGGQQIVEIRSGSGQDAESDSQWRARFG